MYNPRPTRYPGGVSNEWEWQPFGQFNWPNPVTNHIWWDDWDYIDTQMYTVTNASSGSIAAQSIDGGAILESTAATINDFESIQISQATFNPAWDNLSITTSALTAQGSNVLNFSVANVVGIYPGMWVQSIGANTIPVNATVSAVNALTGQVTFTTPVGATVGSATVANGATVYFGSPGKKLGYMTRISSNLGTAASILAGMMNVTAAPFTAANITDGIWFAKASGGNAWTFNVKANSLLTTINLPSAPFSFQTAQVGATLPYLDIGFFIDRLGNFLIYAGAYLVGCLFQSGSTQTTQQFGQLGGTGTSLGAQGQPARSPMYSFNAAIQTGQSVVQPNPPVRNLTPTLSVQASTAAVTTLQSDFHIAWRER